jgi:hypothetical protein
MKGVLPFLGWFVGLLMPVQQIFCPDLAAPVSPVQNIIFLTIHFFIMLFIPHSPATWEGRRAGSPVSGRDSLQLY